LPGADEARKNGAPSGTDQASSKPNPVQPRRHARRAARHVGRHAHRLLAWVASVAAVVTLIVAVAVWRLMQGPIELDWLLPYVQQAFDQAGTGLGVSLTGVRLGIDRATHQLDLRIEDVHLSAATGEKLANFPEMSTSLSLGSLVRGRVAPTQFTVEHPVLQLLRSKDGAISFRIGDTGAIDYRSGLDLAVALLGPAKPTAPLGQLSHLQVRDATVIIDDQRLGKRWQADHIDAAIERDAHGSTGDLSLAVTIGGHTAEVHANFSYAAARRKLDWTLSADGVEPDAFAPLSPVLQPLANAHLPVSGSLASQFDFDEGKFESLRADLGFGAGWLDSDQFPGGRLMVSGGELHAVYVPERKEVRLDRLALDLGDGALLVVDGHVDGITRGLVSTGGTAAEHLPGRLDIDLTNVPVARFAQLWPFALNPASRHWVLANIHGGVLDRASAQFDLSVDANNRSAAVTAAHGTMRYHDLSINYFDGLPLATQVAGTATATADQIEFTPSSGEVKSLKLTGGTVKVIGLSVRDQTAFVDLDVAGPLRDALDLLDANPLRCAHAAGIDPSVAEGRVESQLHFKIPIEFKLKPSDVDYSGRATVTGASLAKVALGRDLSDGRLTIGVTRGGGGQIKGNARFAGIPVAIDGSFAPRQSAGPRAAYRVALQLDDAARQRLGFDLAPERMSGPVGVALTYTVHDAARATAAVALDLRGASLALDEAGWQKPPGQPATATLDFDVSHQAIVGGLRIAAQAAGLDGHLAVALSPGGGAERVDIARLVVGDDDLSGAVTYRDGGWHADIDGRRIDLRPVLKHALASSAASAAPPLTVSARIDRVEFGPHRTLLGVSAALSRSGGIWQSMQIDGRYANGRRLAFRLNNASGVRRIAATSDDLGSALRLMNVAGNVVGGTMTLSGQFIETGGKPALQAQIAGSDYSVVRTPVVTQILSLASFSGLSSMMSGSGIPFSRLRGTFTYGDDRVALDHLIASGESLGITASGSVDLDRDTLDLTGTVAPAHALNSALGNVPVVGSLLMGGEGQSLFAANYELSGTTDDPSVSVNPLSAIAPGFLRQLFKPLSDSGQLPSQPP
jgi:uncharacterized protein YhdP